MRRVLDECLNGLHSCISMRIVSIRKSIVKVRELPLENGWSSSAVFLTSSNERERQVSYGQLLLASDHQKLPLFLPLGIHYVDIPRYLCLYVFRLKFCKVQISCEQLDIVFVLAL